MSLVVAIVGAPNVGKSTLFNRLSKRRVAITHNQPGVTRDRIYSSCNWGGKKFSLIDTGGIEISGKILQEQIRVQVSIAIEESDIILFVVDARSGPTENEYLISNLIRKSQKRTIVVLNKCENIELLDYSIYKLGFKEYLTVSSAHGIGISELVKTIVKDEKREERNENNSRFRLTIIGRPNVGKSSIFNSILKDERSIVSEIPGTTRDSISSKFFGKGGQLDLVDTAGFSRKSKLIETIEHYSLAVTMRSLERADLVLIVIAADEKITHFQQRVAGFADELNKSAIIVINKSDLVRKADLDNFEKELRKELKFLSWAPIIRTSALKKTGIDGLEETIYKVKSNMEKLIPTPTLSAFITEIQILQPPPSIKGRKLVIKAMKQLSNISAFFLLIVNDRKLLHFSYKRYIERKMREYFDLVGVAIRFKIKDTLKK